jgi:HAD superfamily hydrolase (TIGR01509 family)
MKIDGAIFDLDGTLLDSMFVWDTIGEDYLRCRGIKPRENLNKKFKTMSLYQAACYYQREYGLKESTDEIMDGINRMIERFYLENVQPKLGVSEFLAALQQRGVKMCIATATDRHLVEAALSRCGLLQYFSEIFTCTSVGKGKDEADIYWAALEHIGTPKESTWVFEDALYAVMTAKKAGFPVVGVYDSSEADTTTAVREMTDVYIYSFEEMEDFLK